MNPNAVREMLKAHGIPVEPNAGPARPVCDEMLTATELAARLKTTPRTVEKWRSEGVVPAIQVGKVLLFYWPSVVARLLEEYQVVEGRAKAEEPRIAPMGTDGTGKRAVVKPLNR